MYLSKLKTEYRVNPIGLDAWRPRFSWIIASKDKGVTQEKWRLKVLRAEEVVWDSGEVKTDQSVHVVYSGAPLSPATRYDIYVEVTDNKGETARADGFFETGLMDGSAFQADWITHGFDNDSMLCPIFFKGFKLRGPVKSARIYSSALGIYDIFLNGEKAGSNFFAPGWTSYNTRLQYQTLDLTKDLKEDNLIEITVSNGWYKGVFGFSGQADNYGDRVSAIAQISIEYENGSKEVICTDESWRCKLGPIKESEIYSGETIDYTFSSNESYPAKLMDHPKGILTGQESEPVRITKRIKPIAFILTPKNEVVLDFGQNMAAVVEAKLNLPRGSKVTLSHAETLDRFGNFYTENLRSAKAMDTFICSGEDDLFMPRFTFHGFRYVMVEGMGDSLNLDDFTACVLHSDMEETGRFECSSKLVNKLQSNITWSQRSNFLDIPTDCPQRDERLGWTGDAEVFASTAAYNMNTALFFTKWLKDLKAEQTLQHGVPHVIPNILGAHEGSAAWGDAACIVPWEMYKAYGDVRILENQFESMKNWVEYIRSIAAGGLLWQSGHHFGDWVALENDEGPDSATDIYLIATAYYALSSELASKAASVLGYDEEAKAYMKLRDDIAQAFCDAYITNSGRMACNTQTACILALHFNLAKEEQRKAILDSLAANLERHDAHLATGFVGTPYICHVLTDNNRHDLAGKLLLNEDYPSWLYCVKMGATTIWERWNSMKPDGTFDESGMNSFNHYAYGSIGSWMYQKLGGLSILSPGYKKSRIAPMPIKGITSANASLETMYGTLSCSWKLESGRMKVSLSVPANTEAEVALPCSSNEFLLGSGDYEYEYACNQESLS
ncbi:MAG: glycoside hydrolase family 78 protein [Clostridiales bacterium]|jgi:alpha-L-rhamnosidase|nr:glycoside hydrolase family 78 protein [Clostridiales bacterium]